MRSAFRIGLFVCFLFHGFAEASVILLGSAGAGAVQEYSADGTLLGTVGPAGGAASASDTNGDLFIAIPGLDSSTIDEYGPSLNLLNSFTFTAPGDNRTDAAYITDMSGGDSGTLWVSTYSGEVYNLAADGSVLSSFDTGDTSPGVAFDGTTLYTTSGPGFANASTGANPARNCSSIWRLRI